MHFIFNHYWLTSLIKALDNNAEYQEHRLININKTLGCNWNLCGVCIPVAESNSIGIDCCGCLCSLILVEMIELVAVVLSSQLFTLFTSRFYKSFFSVFPLLLKKHHRYWLFSTCGFLITEYPTPVKYTHCVTSCLFIWSIWFC